MNKKTIKVGIIGGLGPLASASFVETIYTTYMQETWLKERYHAPCVYLYSEPLLSQSTAVMSFRQSADELLAKLEKNAAQLLNQDVDCIIICCFTAHALLHKLESVYQDKICSLITNVLDHVIQQDNQFILLSASSTREAQTLENHQIWPKAEHKIAFVSAEAQEQLNAFIKRVKDNQIDAQLLNNFLKFMGQFPNCHFIIACAELHILHKKLQTYCEKQFDEVFDPFYHVTQTIWGEFV